MDEKELNEIAEAWIAGQAMENPLDESSPYLWAIDKVGDWTIDEEPEFVWRLILNVYPRDVPAKVTGILAAGPLEDLLAEFGADYIDQVETLARKDPKFRHLLGGVWPNSTTKEVWERVIKARGETW